MSQFHFPLVGHPPRLTRHLTGCAIIAVAAGAALSTPFSATEPARAAHADLAPIFYVYFPNVRLTRTMTGSIAALGEEQLPRTVPYTGSATLGIGNRIERIGKAAATIKLHGTAGAPRTLKLRWTSSQLNAARRLLRKERRPHAMLYIKLRGVPEGRTNEIRRSFRFYIKNALR